MSDAMKALALLAALGAGAASAEAAHAAPARSVTVARVHGTFQPAPPAGASTVHDLGGQRFDVPPDLLQANGLLINGLAPEAAEFE